MGKLSTYIDNSSNIVDIINHAHQIQIISSNRYQELSKNLDSFTKELVLIFNHKNSTSLHRDEFIQVLDTLNYMFLHSFQRDNDITLLKVKSIQEYFYQGLEIVQADEKQIQDLLSKVEKIRIPFPNDRYQSIINQQIPNYLDSLKNSRGWFHYGLVEDDLDYPLIDGTPLYNSMYYKQGSDLVLFYLKNFYIEQVFLQTHKDEITQLLLEFEIIKGVSCEWIDINLFEIAMNQMITNMLLNNHSSILLKKLDVNLLNNKYLCHDITRELVEIAVINIAASYDSEVKKYIMTHQTLLTDRYMLSLETASDFLIYEDQSNKEVLSINIEDREPSKFNYLSNMLNSYSNLDDKINAINEQELNIYDLIDLLESNLFMNDEYDLFFASLEPIVLAVLLKLRNPELTSFHQQVTLSNQLDDLSNASEWECMLIQYLSSIKKEELEYLDSCINKIQFQ